MTRNVTIAMIGMALMSGASFAENLPPGTTEAWVDERLVTIEVAGSFGSPASDSTTHVIYTSTATLPGGNADVVFVPILETLPGIDNDNTAWAEIDIAFRPGIPPRQLMSAHEVLDAMAAGDIVLSPTGTRYTIDLIHAGDAPGRRMVRGDLLKPSTPTRNETATWSSVKAAVRN